MRRDTTQPAMPSKNARFSAQRTAWAIHLLSVACFSLLLNCSLVAQTAQSMAQAKRLFLDPFGPAKTESVLRNALIKRIEKTGNFVVVDDKSNADAIVTGTGETWFKSYMTTNWRSPNINRQAVYGGYLSVEVLGRDSKVLWSYLATPDRLIWTNIADDLAAKVVKAMSAAAGEEASLAPPNRPRDSLAAASLRGAGATFPAPLYLKWFQSFQSLNPTVRFNYDAIGSEAGIEMLQRSEVDFAGSDAVSADVRDVKLGTGYWRIPVVLGAVVPIYNLPGLLGDLKFTPEILAGIYLGKITKWNDPEIHRWNHGADLPDAEIKVVHRADGSGTTFTFSDYLSKVNAEWREKLGSAFELPWPVGAGAEGSSGMTSAVEKTPYSIGYVELVYAIRQQLAFGSVRNSSGVFVRANLDSVNEAARDSASATSAPASITNPSRKGAYPIATYTWLVLPQQMSDSAKRDALLAFVQWALTEGQKECSALAYTPLPRAVADQQVELVRTLIKPGRAAAASSK